VAAPPLVPLRPNSELVAVAFIGSMEYLSPAMVAMTLPSDVNADGSVAAWVSTGFITVAIVGGTSDPLLPVKRPVAQIDVYGTVPGSNKPPWGQAAALAEAVRYGCWDRIRTPRPLTITAGGVAYPSAVVQAAYFTREPQRMYEDAADYAHLSFDMAFQWLTVNDRLD
jgi:hypothetical protein